MFKQGAVKQTGVSSAALPLSPALSARSYFIDYRQKGALHCSVGSILNIFCYLSAKGYRAAGSAVAGGGRLEGRHELFKRGLCAHMWVWFFISPSQFCCQGENHRGAGGGRRGREVRGGPGPGKMLSGPGKVLRESGGPAQRLKARGALQRGSSRGKLGSLLLNKNCNPTSLTRKWVSKSSGVLGT